ncbi:hypothetical protein Leryth_026588 [Lithospermum erythrorhizon]|nr:hypothetical protein Leryth_026588 [Lithospermum erythrorhizon]
MNRSSNHFVAILFQDQLNSFRVANSTLFVYPKITTHQKHVNFNPSHHHIIKK